MYSFWCLFKIFDEPKLHEKQDVTAIEVQMYFCFRESNFALHFIQVCGFPKINK